MPKRKKLIKKEESLEMDETIVVEDEELLTEPDKKGSITLKAKTNYRLFSGEMVKRDQTHVFTEQEAKELLKKTNCWELV